MIPNFLIGPAIVAGIVILVIAAVLYLLGELFDD